MVRRPVPEAVWASFDAPDAMARALGALRERGHTAVEAFSPFAVSEAAATLPETIPFARLPLLGAVGLPPKVLPWVALVAGVLGGGAGYLVQWFANAWAYPQNAGGRPANAIPAFVFNTFESIVLIGSGAVFLALLLVLRLPKLWNPLEAIEGAHGFTRTSDDAFAIVVRDAELWLAPADTAELLRGLGATEVRQVVL